MISAEGWPALSAESRTWTPSIPAELVSAATRERHSGSYLASVVPTIGTRVLVLPTSTAALADEASAEIARFDTALGTEIAPFATVLLRSESASSSMIENLTSGAKSIVLAELGSRDKRNATEIVGNVAAMTAALSLADRLDGSAILEMHRALVGRLHPEFAGRWRDEQVWIGGSSYGPHQADFVPPHHEYVPSLVDDLISFLARRDIPLLAQAAVAHAQFETIHPFVDGNGRTGRALIHSLLRARDLTRNVTVPVSAGLLSDTPAYFAALTAYREGDIAAIVERLAAASFEATINGRQLVERLREIRRGWDDGMSLRRGASAWRVADLVLRQPVIDAALTARELGIEQRNAQRSIAPLVDAGILTEFTGFRRNRMWQAREVLTALDEFADRARRTRRR